MAKIMLVDHFSPESEYQTEIGWVERLHDEENWAAMSPDGKIEFAEPNPNLDSLIRDVRNYLEGYNE